MDVRNVIRTIPDFPKPGVQFRDITTLVKDPAAFAYSVDWMAQSVKGLGANLVVGPEARGYIFSATLALTLGIGLVLARKPGKLPAETVRTSYGLEYGADVLEMHRDSIRPGDKVIIADDLLATGGTALAVCRLIEELGGEVVAARFLIELPELNGRETLKGYNIDALAAFDGD